MNEASGPVPGVEGDVKANAFRNLLSGNFGKDDSQLAKRLAYTLGIPNPNDLLDKLGGRNLLEEQKNRPFREKARDFAAQRLRFAAPMSVGMENQASFYEAQTRSKAKSRVAGLDNILYQRGLSLDDILKHAGIKETAGDIRQRIQARGSTGLNSQENKDLSSILQIEPKDFANLEDFAPEGVIDNAKVRLFRSLKGMKSSLEDFALLSVKRVKDIAELPAFSSLNKQVSGYLDNYAKRKNNYLTANANSLPMMIQNAGFTSAREFGTHLSNLGMNSDAVAKVMRGKIGGKGGTAPADTEFLAQILGVDKKKLENVSTLMNTIGRKPLPMPIDAIITGFQKLPSIIEFNGKEAFQAASQQLKNIGQLSLRKILWNLKDAIGSATAKLTTDLGGKLYESYELKNIKKWQYTIASTGLRVVNLVGMSLAKGVARLSEIAPVGAFEQLINQAYRGIPTVIRGTGNALRKILWSIWGNQ